MKNRHFIYIIVFVISLGLLLLWYAGRPKQERVVMVKPSLQSSGVSQELVQRDVTLYFSSESGEYLFSEARQVGCSGEEGCVQAVVEALISGPLQDGSPVLPENCRVLSVRLEEGTAFLDFSSEFSTGHPGGSQSELLTVYALANTVAVNFPHIRQTGILINGQPVETLKGHVDLTRPLIADFTYARQSVADRLATLESDGEEKGE